MNGRRPLASHPLLFHVRRFFVRRWTFPVLRLFILRSQFNATGATGPPSRVNAAAPLGQLSVAQSVDPWR